MDPRRAQPFLSGLVVKKRLYSIAANANTLNVPRPKHRNPASAEQEQAAPVCSWRLAQPLRVRTVPVQYRFTFAVVSLLLVLSLSLYKCCFKRYMMTTQLHPLTSTCKSAGSSSPEPVV